MLFLTNDHIEEVLDMPGCIDVIEEAYQDIVAEKATYRPRIDLYVPQEPHYYRWGTMEGATRSRGVFAIRMKSDMLVWEDRGSVQTEDKYCVEPGTYCGLIFLFSVKDGRPLALMNDGFLQHMRVGACAGIGAKYLSRPDSKVLGMIGSGGMARTYLSAITHVRSIEKLKVYSPTKEHSEAYAEEVRSSLGIDVVCEASAEDAVRGSDIVALCTDSVIPVIEASWLEPGMHVTNVRANEAGIDVVKRADVIARLGTMTLPREGLSDVTVVGGDGMTGYIAGSAKEAERIPKSLSREIDNPNIGTIPDLMANRWPGRTSDSQITFINNQGTQGLQFAAVGSLVYERATERRLGHHMPDEWFLQDIRD